MSVLFRTIQNMKMHLRTAFGVSSSFYTGNDLPFQGAVQGKGSVPDLWLIISMFLTRHLHHKNVVTKIITPVSKISHCLAALMHVDDTDLHVFNDDLMSRQEVLTYE